MPDVLFYAPPRPRRRWWVVLLRWLAAAGFVAAGANHFRNPEFYRRIVPPLLPSPRALVAVSGVCEIIGGLGLLVRPLRRAAGWGLIALLVAVFPANLYMATNPERFPDLHLARWLLWLRLPLQAVMIAWVWCVSTPPAQTSELTRPRGGAVS